MSDLKLFRVTGELEDVGEDEYLVVAESVEDAERVWTDGQNGGYTRDDGYTFKGAEPVPDDELLEFGGGDDGWGEHLPDGAEVLTRYGDHGGLEGTPNLVRTTAGSLARFFGKMTISDPNW